MSVRRQGSEAVRASVLSGLLKFRVDDLAGVPFRVGQYPDRPAPAHVSSNLAETLLGNSGRVEVVGKHRVSIITALLNRGASHSLLEKAGPRFDRVRTPETLPRFTSILSVLFDSDGKVFPTQGSPALFYPGISESVASDEGYADAIIEALGPDRVQEIRSGLVEALTPIFHGGQPENGPAAARIHHLVLEVAKRVSVSEPKPAGAVPSGLGDFDEYGAMLVRVLEKASEGGEGWRLLRLKDFATLLFAMIPLGILAGSREARRERGKVSVFAVPGVPPSGGVHQSDLLDAAQKSFSSAVVESHRRIADALASIVGVATENRDGGMDVNSLLHVYADGSGHAPNEKQREVLIAFAQEVTGKKNRTELLNQLMTVEYLGRTVKLIGSKVGLAGPTRGGGRPRIYLETGLLNALVTGLVRPDEEEITFAEFIYRLWATTGIVCGYDSRMNLDFSAVLGTGDPDIAPGLLQSSSKALQDRMISAGLARRFSDGTVVVFG